MLLFDRSSPLRIAMFTAYYAPYVSGVSLGVQARVRWLLEQGHEVLLIYPKIDHQYPDEVRHCSMPGLDELQFFPRFSAYAYPTKPLLFYKICPEPQHHRYWSDTQLLENFQPDLVLVSDPIHMWGFNSFFWGGYGRPVGQDYKRKTGTPTLALFHTDYLTYGRHYVGALWIKLLSPLIFLLFKRFSRAYTLNCFSSKKMLAKYKAMGFQSCAYVTYLGIDCEKFHPRNLCYDPIPDDPRPVLLFVGRLALEKNIFDLLDAFELIVPQLLDLHLVIVGSGPQEKVVRRKAARFGKRVTVWGKSLGTELLGWFARADLFVNPSTSENFCRTNMEALASGTPVVAANAGGNPEQIQPGFNGLLSQPNNPVDLAHQVMTVFQNPQLKAKITQQARPSALQFDWSVCLRDFEAKLYESANRSSSQSSQSRKFMQCQVYSP